MTAITAITAQNTIGVSRVEAVAPETIVAQVRAVAEDIGVDAVKIGMLGTAATVDAVVEALSLVGEAPVVVDPVMVAESGATLLDDGAREAVVERLLPLAAVATPNIPEAEALAGAGDRVTQHDLARAVLALGPRAVVVTGGHSEQNVDLFSDGRQTVQIEGERHPAGASHGSGCTHSSVLAARLALGDSPLDAARAARRIASEAVGAGLRGGGEGPGRAAPRGGGPAGGAGRRPARGRGGGGGERLGGGGRGPAGGGRGAGPGDPPRPRAVASLR